MVGARHGGEPCEVREGAKGHREIVGVVVSRRPGVEDDPVGSPAARGPVDVQGARDGVTHLSKVVRIQLTRVHRAA